MIEITLLADRPLTTSDLRWFMDAVDGASGHSGEDVPILITGSQITAQVPSGDEEDEPKEDRPIQAGDRVRVIDSGDKDLIERVGKLVRIDEEDETLPYLVELPDSEQVWIRKVERV